MVNEQSGFEPVKVYCITQVLTSHFDTANLFKCNNNNNDDDDTTSNDNNDNNNKAVARTNGKEILADSSFCKIVFLFLHLWSLQKPSCPQTLNQETIVHMSVMRKIIISFILKILRAFARENVLIFNRCR